jgi:cyclopropane fatty-acyl-phospholipid synthase-like methyltransferase
MRQTANGQLGPDFYDNMHAEIGQSVTRTRYDGLFRKIVANVRDHGSRSILEVGCGSGFLAKMILQEYSGAYRGFDFSAEAIRNAGSRTGHPELFSVGDALDGRSYAGNYDTIVCTEMLEHVDRDLDVIRLWRDGTWCVCSVPNFDYAGHVRFFNAADEVAARYGGPIDIEAIIKISRPIMPDRRIRSYMRNLRWSRNNPSEFLGFLGIQTFSRLGGWFLFFGTKTGGNGRAGC